MLGFGDVFFAGFFSSVGVVEELSDAGDLSAFCMGRWVQMVVHFLWKSWLRLFLDLVDDTSKSFDGV